MSDLFVNTVFVSDIAFILNFYMLDTKRLLKGCVVVGYLNILNNLLFEYKKVTILLDFFS